MSEGVTAGVVCVGGAVLDLHLHLLAPAVAATSNPARSRTSFGGVARNVAENLAGLGVRPRLVSCVGDDAAGRDLLEAARLRGIDVTGVRTVEGPRTAEYVAVLSPDGDLVLGVAAMDVLDRIGLVHVRPALVDPPAWVFLDCNLRPDALAETARAAHGAGARVAVDAVSTAKVARLPQDLSGIDVLFVNRDEARALLVARGVPAHEPDEAVARALLATGAGAVVLTRGAAGVIVADPVRVTSIPSFEVRVVDVTGAGDALVAGTLAGLLTGQDLPDAVAGGLRLAGLTVASEHSVRPDLSPRMVWP